MSLFISKILNSLVQIILFAIIPFIWWLVSARKEVKFSEWIGLKKIEGGKKTVVAIIITAFAFLLLGAVTLYFLQGVETATSEFAGLGAKAIPAIIIYAVFNTSFPEELVFRGFLLKRIASKFGFNVANWIQALLFGLMHGVMFISVTGVLKAVLIILFTSAIAWFMGNINEKKSNGSILPSWIIHAISNIFSGICAAFSIL
ncbi:MAG: CPBP family intramembrane metalloprotease [Treponema sp.]|nr:CPBP family intramembrane metalloprotease [Treponema sp.]